MALKKVQHNRGMFHVISLAVTIYPGRRERLSGRDLSNPEKLDKKSLSQIDLLQPAPERRTLRSLGTAGAV
jgi:hypothetical protein